MTNNKIQHSNDYLEVSENQRNTMKTSSFCFGIFNDKPSSYWGTTTYGNPHLFFIKHPPPAKEGRRSIFPCWQDFGEPFPRQESLSRQLSLLQGSKGKDQKSSQTHQTLPAKIWNWKTQMNPNDNSRVFLRDQILGFDFYACVESAWTTVLASHKGLRASAPHNSLPSLGLDARKAHLSKCGPTKLSQCMLVLCRGRFASCTSRAALKVWRLHSWCFGPWSLLSKGDFERKQLPCPHLRLPGRAMTRCFSPGHGKKLNSQSYSN